MASAQVCLDELSQRVLERLKEGSAFQLNWLPQQQIQIQSKKPSEGKVKNQMLGTDFSKQLIEDYQDATTEEQKDVLTMRLLGKISIKLDFQKEGNFTVKNKTNQAELEEDLNQLVKLAYGGSKQMTVTLESKNQMVLTITEKGQANSYTYRVSVRESQSFLEQLAKQHQLNKKIERLKHFLSQAGATRHKDWSLTPLNPVVIPGTLIEYAKEQLVQKEQQINTRYYKPIETLIQQYPGSSTFLKETWDSRIKKEVKGVLSLKELAHTDAVQEVREFDSLILKSQTYEVRLTEGLSRNQLVFESNNQKIQALLKTEDALRQYLPYLALIEESLRFAQQMIKEQITLLKQQPNYQQIQPFYDAAETLKKEATPSFNYKTMEMVFLTGQRYELNSMESCQKAIKKEVSRCVLHVSERSEALKQELDGYRTGPITYYVLLAIQEMPQKGITTYVDILKGKQTAKIKEYHYDKLKSYGTLAKQPDTLIRETIETTLEKEYVKTKKIRASFGTYEGYLITNVGLKTLAATPKPESLKEDPIESVTDFLKAMNKGYSAETTIPELKHVQGIHPEEVLPLIEFITYQRTQYRKLEAQFVASVSRILTAKYAPLIEQNSYLTTGVVQKTFKYILKQLN